MMNNSLLLFFTNELMDSLEVRFLLLLPIYILLLEQISIHTRSAIGVTVFSTGFNHAVIITIIVITILGLPILLRFSTLLFLFLFYIFMLLIDLLISCIIIVL